MKTEGIGWIQAWPVGAPDEQTGEVAFVVDEKNARLRLHRKGGLWEATTEDGRELTVPVAFAVITWGPQPKEEEVLPDPRRRAAPPPGATRRMVVDGKLVRAVRDSKGLRWADHALQKPVPPPPEPPVIKCKGCDATYLDPVDAYVCLRRDTHKDESPVFKGGDCKSCGYPLELHQNAVLKENPPEEAFEERVDGHGDTVRTKVMRQTWTCEVVPPNEDADYCHLMVEGDEHRVLRRDAPMVF